MLTGLLPGVRELRAPLAAGYVWLLAAWLAFEHNLPEGGPDGGGIVHAVYRLNEALSGFGLVAAASFAAYLIGSLSATVFSRLLRRLLLRMMEFKDGRYLVEPLTRNVKESVERLARRCREDITTDIALVGGDAEERLLAELERPDQEPNSVRTSLLTMLANLPGARSVSVRGVPAQHSRVLGHDSPGPLLITDRIDGRLARAIVDDLDLVLRTRLLGKDAEYYSAVDRVRAEVEFRLAVIPPLLGLVFAAGRTIQPAAFVGVLVVAAAASIGLYLDAFIRHRQANDMLAEALSDARVSSPSLERIKGWAKSASSTRTRREAGMKAARAVADALAAVDQVDSAPRSADRAKAAVDAARSELSRLGGDLSAVAKQLGAETLEALAQVPQLILNSLDGSGVADDPWRWREEGRAKHEEFVRALRDELGRLEDSQT